MLTCSFLALFLSFQLWATEFDDYQCIIDRLQERIEEKRMHDGLTSSDLHTLKKSLNSLLTKPYDSQNYNLLAKALSKQGRIGQELIAHVLAKELQVSLVEQDQAKQLFAQLEVYPHIPYHNIKDGCYVRAHEMSLILEGQNILPGKVWVTGQVGARSKLDERDEFTWNYHVAPFLLVRTSRGIELQVLDPSITSGPVKYSDWVDQIMLPRATIRPDVVFSRRFALTPRDQYEHRDRYDEKLFMRFLDSLSTYQRGVPENRRGVPWPLWYSSHEQEP